MAAIIRCRLCLGEKEFEELVQDEDAFARAWGQVAYYLENIERVEFR